MQRLCVFFGSVPASRPPYPGAAREPGTTRARRGFGFVYGGGSIGLMWVRAVAALASATVLIGVIPRGLYSADIWLTHEEA